MDFGEQPQAQHEVWGSPHAHAHALWAGQGSASGKIEIHFRENPFFSKMDFEQNPFN